MRLQRDAPALDERIYVPQHAGGCFKQFGMRDDATLSGYCELAGSDLLDRCYPTFSVPSLIFRCDTDLGSHGAPLVAYNTNKVIGIHHCSLRVGACENTAIPITQILPELEPFIYPAEVEDVRVVKILAAAGIADLQMAWAPTPGAADYRIYEGRLFDPTTGSNPPGSHGHLADSASIPARGACTTSGLPTKVFGTRGNWLDDEDDIYLLVVAVNCRGDEGAYGTAPVAGFANPPQPIPAGTGCP